MEYSHSNYINRNKKTEPKFKVGDWVVQINSDGFYHSIPLQLTDSIMANEPMSWYKLWLPQESEWCVFWHSKLSYTVRQYLNSHDNYHYENTSITGWAYVAPLEFIQTLRDK